MDLVLAVLIILACLAVVLVPLGFVIWETEKEARQRARMIDDQDRVLRR